MNVLEELKNRKFRSDEVLHTISKDYVSCNKHDIKLNNAILKQVITDTLIKKMKEADHEFRNLFETVMYGGSFYKGLKVSKPDEYDLNLVIKLNIDYDLLEVEPENHSPGFVSIKAHQRQFSRNQNFWNEILDENGYLDQNKFHSWMQSILDRTLNRVKNQDGNSYIFRTKKNSHEINYRQSGPAFTIKVNRIGNNKSIDFDLVPCLIFENRRLQSYRHSEENKWIAIAKPLHSGNLCQSPLWRTSFYFDEKQLLTGHIKHIIRMVKKLRDIRNWTELKSYFIETFFLHLLHDNSDFADNYDKASRTCIFIYVLRRLQEVLESGRLPYFWQSGQDLFSTMNSIYIRNIANELKTIINRIDGSIIHDPFILLKIFRLE